MTRTQASPQQTKKAITAKRSAQPRTDGVCFRARSLIVRGVNVYQVDARRGLRSAKLELLFVQNTCGDGMNPRPINGLFVRGQG